MSAHNAPASPRTLVNDLRLAGVSLVARAGKIAWSRPGKPLTAEQVDRLRQHRAEVLAHLEQEGPDHEHRPGVDGLPPGTSWEVYWAIQRFTL
jgi:hypothetical protein